MLPTHQMQTISLLPQFEQVLVRAKFAEPKAVDLDPNDAQQEIAKLIMVTIYLDVPTPNFKVVFVFLNLRNYLVF